MTLTQDEKMDKVRALLFDVQTRYIPFHAKKEAADSVATALFLLQEVNAEIQHDRVLEKRALRQAAITKRNAERLVAEDKRQHMKCEYGHEFATEKKRRICPMVEPITGRKCKGKLHKVN